MTRRLKILTTVTALAVSAGAASAGASNSSPTHRAALLENTLISGYSAKTLTVNQTATTGMSSGIIMRDGGVCDPIRHMGC